MIVYHGSYTEITKIDLSKCEPNKDFGKGFYVTKIKEQAEIIFTNLPLLMACTKFCDLINMMMNGLILLH